MPDKTAIPLPTDDTEVLALTIWAEARGEDSLGRMGVACVILNRVKHAQDHAGVHKGAKFWWGNSIAECCLKPWQFSCWNENDPNRQKMLDGTAKTSRAYSECLEIAKLAVAGELEDVTNGADSYLNPDVAKPQPWSIPENLTWEHGHHRFYRTAKPV